MPLSGQITAGELTRVCAHYDLGTVTAARKLKRGSGASPKVILESTNRRYLLKRRAPGRDDPATVALAHEVQLHLSQHGFPTPRLVTTRRGNHSMLQLDGHIYELFVFVEGRSFDRSPFEAEQAGGALAQLHELLRDMAPSWQPTVASYHAAPGVLQRLSSIPELLGETQARQTTRELRAMYRLAANEAGRRMADWRPEQLIHADWHPGNMIFSVGPSRPGNRLDPPAGTLIAVVDFDSIRRGSPVVDLANAALQFSILRGVSPLQNNQTGSKRRPDEIDITRLQAFCNGYHVHTKQPIRRGEIEALPWLMIEALVTEAAVTIAATGKFGPVDGWDMLRLVLRKGQWIHDSAATMIDAATRAI